MANRYAKQASPASVPQTEALPGTTQVPNAGGGYGWKVDKWAQLHRFLILGNEGGTYYAGEREMTLANSAAALACIKEDGPRVVRTLVSISDEHRAPKNDPAIFVLAMAAKRGDPVTRKHAFAALQAVCRTGTHLFQFIDAASIFGGWSRGMRTAVGNWYKDKSEEFLSYQLIKYRQREGWTHGDVLRSAHPALGTTVLAKFALDKLSVEEKQAIQLGAENVPRLLTGFMRAQNVESEKQVVKIIEEFPGLPSTAVPTQFLTSPKVWQALLPSIKMTELIRSLGKLTSYGLFDPMSTSEKFVIKALGNEKLIRNGRIHPIMVLGAMLTYKQGRSVKGDLHWNPSAKILDALDEAFYISFGNVKPSNKRTMLALDVSGSMSGGAISAMPGLTPRVGSSAMAMVTARTEPDYSLMAFSSNFIPLTISPKQRLDDVCRMTQGLPFDGTDCALPMLWALKNNISIDTFVIYTDDETNGLSMHPSTALEKYRQKTGIPAKLAVVAMTAGKFTIADPEDAGMMNFVGFDTATPQILADFSITE